ncbi:Arylsulfatase [Arcticibacter svalbardensis MN12-7]|uniref:Arylsulfatase n=1 Tax=Arcticibacter svalbardensis MN12-7 TaxID=1150600 RepID=R9GRW4_9SPHI|nr:arylsulfatase [Arcticibacter svalbardensis]EOR94587.1 Arylsulfatase [Arcticibacter svalbardensis MN12-7]
MIKSKYFLVVIIFVITDALNLLQAKTVPIKQPNVIIILVDDQGYGDLACLGNKYIKTPNMDALYNESARFTNYHVSPTCAPTRSALMTGRHADRAGVWHTINGRSILLERETTMAQSFKENGYATGIFGKWHLGDYYPSRPQDKGFEEVLINGGGGVNQTPDYFDNDYFDDTYSHNGKLEKYKGYCTDVWFENAIKFIEGNKNKPYFCYIPTNAAHIPYYVADKYSKQYENNPNIPNAAFYSMISNVDENIGKLITYLKSTKQLDNTILIFSTDNGSSAGADLLGNGADGFVSKGFNAGMRGLKASMYEGGHRVPLFMHWKDGGISVGTDINELTAHYDIFPTLVELCKLKLNKNLNFDGKSLAPLIKGDTKDFKDRIIITDSQRDETPIAWKRTSLMQENWRLINGTELYDIKIDPEQRNNIASKYPDKVNEYKKEYAAWWKKLEPNFKIFPLIYIGHQGVNPVTLYCHDWHTDKDSPWNQNLIRDGYKDNGYWLLKVDQSGTYKIKLRRWPEEIHVGINEGIPARPAIAGTTVTASNEGKALKITKAAISIQGIELSKNVTGNPEFLEFEVKLKKGEAKLQSFFTLGKNETIGAYYVSIEKI